MKLNLISSIFILLLLSSSCGTLFTGSSNLVGINSEPEKAKVYVNGMYIGLTPTSASLKRDKDHSIVLKKEGYEDASAVITRSFNGVAILNLLSPICWIVDIVTGGMWKFEREGITVEMEPIKTASKSPINILPANGMEIKKLENGKTAIYSK